MKAEQLRLFVLTEEKDIMDWNEKIFENPPAEYRAKPFWALNGKLERSELKRQIECMKQMGFGGAFLHSRTGLITEYMGDEWLSLLDYAVDVLHENGMDAYLYDEDRWPSGTCGGLVTKTKEFRAKSMVYDIVTAENYVQPENFLGLFAVIFAGKAVKSYRKIASPAECKAGETLLAFSYLYMLPDSFYNGYTYVDTMNRAATERFIELTHERYQSVMGKKFGKEIVGIFTDEPHRGSLLNGFSRKEEQKDIEIPYTYCLFEEFYRRRGYRIEERLPVLWFGKADEPFCKEMYDLIEVEEQLFLENYAKPYYDWCHRHKLIVTGHVLHEDNLAAQTTMCGSVMRYYPYMDYPGMDNLGEKTYVYNVPKLVSSVARQLDKKFVLDELYGCTGWHMRLCDYKRTGDWQSAGGVSLRCPHLSWYTMKGEGKRDYPASILHQASWWRDFFCVEDYFARMQYLLGCGRPTVNTAMINPVESTWGLTNRYSYQNFFSATQAEYQKIESAYYNLYKQLLFAGKETDYIDEGIFAEHGSVRGGQLVCGSYGYRNIVLGGNLNLRSTTLNALKQFMANGGRLIVAGDLPAYLDGVRHDFTADLKGALLCECDGAQVARLLEDEVQVTCSVPMIVVRRQTENGTLVFLLNPPEYENTVAKIVIKTSFAPVALNLRNGKREAIEYTRIGNDIVIERCFARDEELMLWLSDETPPKKKEPSLKEVALAQSFAFELNEPNVMVLDRAVCTVDGKPLGEGNILDLDSKVRGRFGLAPRSNEMVQPWFQQKFGGARKRYGNVQLRFTFDMEAIPQEVMLMGEDFESTEIFLNGAAVDRTQLLQTPIDCCFRLVKLPRDRLQKGENTLVLSLDFYGDTNLEGLFLCGSFGVRTGERDCITALPQTLSYGDLRQQGLPYYGGTVILKAPLENGAYRVETEELDCALVKINGTPMAFPPFAAETAVENGELQIALVMTRYNMFGCIDYSGGGTLRAQGLLHKLKVYRID